MKEEIKDTVMIIRNFTKDLCKFKKNNQNKIYDKINSIKLQSDAEMTSP